MEDGDVITKVVKDKKTQPVSAEGLPGLRQGPDELSVFVLDVRNPTEDGQFLTLSKKAPVEDKGTRTTIPTRSEPSLTRKATSPGPRLARPGLFVSPRKPSSRLCSRSDLWDMVHG